MVSSGSARDCCIRLFTESRNYAVYQGGDWGHVVRTATVVHVSEVLSTPDWFGLRSSEDTPRFIMDTST